MCHSLAACVFNASTKYGCAWPRLFTAMPEPKTGDEIVLANGTTYSIVRAGKVDPAGTKVLYDLQLRGV